MPILNTLLALKSSNFVTIEGEIVVAEPDHDGVGEGIALVDAHARHQLVLLIHRRLWAQQAVSQLGRGGFGEVGVCYFDKSVRWHASAHRCRSNAGFYIMQIIRLGDALNGDEDSNYSENKADVVNHTAIACLGEYTIIQIIIDDVRYNSIRCFAMGCLRVLDVLFVLWNCGAEIVFIKYYKCRHNCTRRRNLSKQRVSALGSSEGPNISQGPVASISLSLVSGKPIRPWNSIAQCWMPMPPATSAPAVLGPASSDSNK